MSDEKRDLPTGVCTMTKLGDMTLKDIGTFLLFGFAIFGLGCAAAIGITAIATAISAHPADTLPTPVTTPVQSYPTTITYTVLSTTTSTGHFQIYATDGKILYCMDYYDYNINDPQNTYVATVTGMDGNAYLISSPQIIAYGSDLYPQYPVYYNYGGKYYQTDGVVTDPVTWKQVHGERLIYGKPPYYYRR